MKKTFYFFTVTALIATFVACEKEQLGISNKEDFFMSMDNSQDAKISLNDAKMIASDFMQKNRECNTFRSSEQNSIKKTEFLIDDKDTLMYLINFDEGFVFIGASLDMYPVLGFADNSNLYIDDIENNLGLSLWLEKTKYDIRESLNNPVEEVLDPLAWIDITTTSKSVGLLTEKVDGDMTM